MFFASKHLHIPFFTKDLFFRSWTRWEWTTQPSMSPPASVKKCQKWIALTIGSEYMWRKHYQVSKIKEIYLDNTFNCSCQSDLVSPTSFPLRSLKKWRSQVLGDLLHCPSWRPVLQLWSGLPTASSYPWFKCHSSDPKEALPNFDMTLTASNSSPITLVWTKGLWIQK